MRYAASDLKEFTARILRAAGATEEDADLVAEGLVSADLRGVHSHGVIRTGVYARRLRAGSINPRARLTVLHDGGAVVVVDAQAGLGIVMAARAMDLAIERARQHGIGAVGVRNSNHCGMLAFLASRAIGQRMIGIAMSNADAQVAPWGARDRYLGTNPICVAIPAGEETPIVLDMATSTVAHGRIRAAALRGEPIPEDWALDPEGRPTRDPQHALQGALRPFGGPKGSGLAVVVDILAGILPGALSGPEITPLHEALERAQGLGQLVLALSLHPFGAEDVFRRRVDRLIRDIRALRPAPDCERVFVPGEIEHLRMQDYQAAGIPLPPEVVAELDRLSAQTGIPVPRPHSAGTLGLGTAKK